MEVPALVPLADWRTFPYSVPGISLPRRSMTLIEVGERRNGSFQGRLRMFGGELGQMPLQGFAAEMRCFNEAQLMEIGSVNGTTASAVSEETAGAARQFLILRRRSLGVQFPFALIAVWMPSLSAVPACRRVASEIKICPPVV